jgi:hypothetical protein
VVFCSFNPDSVYAQELITCKTSLRILQLSVLFKQFLHPTILDRARHDGIHHKNGEPKLKALSAAPQPTTAPKYVELLPTARMIYVKKLGNERRSFLTF